MLLKIKEKDVGRESEKTEVDTGRTATRRNRTTWFRRILLFLFKNEYQDDVVYSRQAVIRVLDDIAEFTPPQGGTAVRAAGALAASKAVIIIDGQQAAPRGFAGGQQDRCARCGIPLPPQARAEVRPVQFLAQSREFI